MLQQNSAGDQLVLVVEGPDLPTSEADRQTVLRNLDLVVSTVLDDYDTQQDYLKVIDGHAYSAIAADCPCCGKSLQLTEVELNSTNGALARAVCPVCQWRGDAMYRLVDLHDRDTGDDDELRRFQETSSVKHRDVTPRYYPY